MENDFAYEQLSPRVFEQLAVALVEPVLGAGLEVFEPGRDGGREATWDGPVNWAATDADDTTRWQGHTVIQVKHCQNPTQDPGTDLAWLQGHLKTELDTWMKADSKRTRFPNYLLVVTNVRLTPADPGGTMDKLQRWIAKALKHNRGTDRSPRTLRSKGLREVRVWHRNKVNNVLAGNSDVRQRLTPLITVGDVLARIGQLSGAVPPDRLPAVFTDHARKSLETGRWIRFDDAGDGQAKHVVDDVIVNLPVETEHGRSTALRQVLDRGDRVLRKSLWYFETDGQPPPPRHLVITGAAGNRKSTLTRYLTHLSSSVQHQRKYWSCQPRPDPGSRTGIASPTQPRPDLPAQVGAARELAATAEAMGPDEGGPNVYRYMCGLISERSQVDIQPSASKRGSKHGHVIRLTLRLNERRRRRW